MNVKELKRKLVHYCEVVYVDERGNQGKIYRFDEESEACTYLLETLKREMEL